jgi:molybdate transport system ATP-binding protein/molybdate/tungstate transport system ATP-binding protein
MIKFLNVSITLGDFLLEDVTLEIKPGEFFSILGPTGTGKTVILELIAGLYRPDTGRVLINGTDFEAVPPEKRKIGFVYQDYALFPHLNVYRNIAFGLQLQKLPPRMIKESVKVMADMLGIEHLLERSTGTLSGGEQQRVSLARALIMKPEILLLDEPFGALDPGTKKLLCQELKKMHENYRCTVVHVTHDFNEAGMLADRIGIILKGIVRQTGVYSEVFEKPRDQEVASFLGQSSQ